MASFAVSSKNKIMQVLRLSLILFCNLCLVEYKFVISNKHFSAK
jgi:hypothetical protein